MLGQNRGDVCAGQTAEAIRSSPRVHVLPSSSVERSAVVGGE
jgi:hypothetical protein